MFRDNGIRFVSLLDNIDTYARGSKLNSRVHAIFDEEQLDLLSANIRKSFEEKSKDGQFFGSMPPFGYKKDPANKNHLIIDEDAACVVRMIFEMAANGSTYLAIAKRLNDCGYPIPSVYKKQQGYNVEGMYTNRMNLGMWTRDMVRTFLTNEVYRGTIINHKSTVVNFRTKKKKNIPKGEHIKVKNMHEAIIDEELWNKVQTLRKSRRKAGNGVDGTKHPLSGIVYCECCGAKMYKCKSGGIPYFRCYKASSTGECENHKRIRLDELEQLIIDKINEVIVQYTNRDEVSRSVVIINRFEQRINKCIQRKKSFEQSLEDKFSGLKKLLSQYLDNVIDKSVYEAVQRDYLSEREEIENKINSLNTEIESLKSSMAAQSDKEEIIKKHSHIDALTITIVQEFIESVIIGPYDTETKNRDITVNMTV